MTIKLIYWKSIVLGSRLRQIPVPTKAGMVVLLLMLLYLVFASVRFIWFYGDWHTFTSEELGYSIEYPAHWYHLGEYTNGYKNKNDLNVDFINGTPLLIPSNISVEIHHRTIPNGSFLDLILWGEEFIQITGGAKEISPPEEILIGTEEYPAIVRSYQRHFTGMDKDVYVISGDDAYLLHFSASSRKWNEAQRIFDHMLGSFQLPTALLHENQRGNKDQR